MTGPDGNRGTWCLALPGRSPRIPEWYVQLWAGDMGAVVCIRHPLLGDQPGPCLGKAPRRSVCSAVLGPARARFSWADSPTPGARTCWVPLGTHQTSPRYCFNFQNTLFSPTCRYGNQSPRDQAPNVGLHDTMAAL